MKSAFLVLLALFNAFTMSKGLRFELGESKEPYCIRDFATPGQLIVVDILVMNTEERKIFSVI